VDSLTQLALGASLGEVALGRRVGRKAMAWGALAGTLPDLDVLAYPLLTAAQELRWHRGPTHSLFFAPLAAPLLGLLVAWIYRHRHDAHSDWRGWAWLFFLALWTHPLVDWLTVYGTQLLWPLTDHPYELGALFIIDPLYTLPLLVALVRSAFTADARTRLRWNTAALVLSTLYAGWGIGAKLHVERLAWDNLRVQGLADQVDGVLAKATPLNTVAWEVIARSDTAVWTSRYAFTEGDTRFGFAPVSRQWELTDAVDGTYAFETIQWFSKGYNAARPAGGDTLLHILDLRFGRVVPRAPGPDAGYVFVYDFFARDAGVTFAQRNPDPDAAATLRLVWQRVLGRDPAPDPHELATGPAPSALP
jgi:inner membrane protein